MKRRISLLSLAMLLAALLVLIPAAASAQTPEPTPVPTPSDGRLDTGAFSIVPYCRNGGFLLLRTNPYTNQGEYYMEASAVEVGNAMATAITSGRSVLIKSLGAVSMYALPSYEVQINDWTLGSLYTFTVGGTACGAPISSPGAVTGSTAAAAPVVQQPPQQFVPLTLPSTTTNYGSTYNAGGRIHYVQPGENLFRISLRYGVSMQRIAAANGLVSTHWIYAGQPLIIP